MTPTHANAQYPRPLRAISQQFPHTRDQCDTRAQSSSRRSPPAPPVPAPRSPASPKPARRSRRAPTGRAPSLYVLRSKYSLPCASFHSRAKTGSRKSFRQSLTSLPPASPAPYTAPACPSQIPDTLPSSSQRPPTSSRPAPAPSFYLQSQPARPPAPISQSPPPDAPARNL